MSVIQSPAQRVPDGIDGAQLQQLRVAAGLDPTVLAIRTSLSKAQVLQIENGGHDLFYNASIKRACARKLAVALGIDPDRVVAAVPAAQVHSASIDPRVTPTWQAVDPMHTDRWRGPLKGVWASAAIALAVMALGVTQANWGDGSFSPLAQRLRDWAVSPYSLLAPWAKPALEAPTHGVDSVAVKDGTGALMGVDSPAQSQPLATPTPTAQAQTDDCPQATDQSPVVQPLKAFKAGQMVFVQALGDQHLCLRDHSGQVWSVTFRAGQERTFQGSPPWSVQSASLSQFNVFFQGWRLHLPEDTTDSVRIVELQR